MTAVGSSGNLGSVGHAFTYKGNATTTTEQVDTYTSTVTPTSGTAADTVYSYTYDNNGNIRTITKDGILQYTYNYDEAGQLTRADDAVQNKSFTYTYDVGGNIVSKKEYAYTTSTLGSVVDTISYTYDGTWKDKLVSYDGNSITYDAIGNPLTYSGYTFEWNGRILNSITGNSKTLNFKYNENGLRTEKKVTQNSITTTYSYIWHDQKLVSQSDGTNTFYFFYNDSKYAPDGFVLNGTDTYLYTKNLQGDITGIADANGSIVTTYTYDAWGKIISVTGTQSATIGTANPFRYRGYYYDTETEWYYLQSRYYNPEWDRFINADDVAYLGASGTVLGNNIFSYCENNPVNYSNPSGHIAANVVGAIVGGIIGAVGGYLLTRWLADKLNLSGWKRNVFIWGLTAVITASAAAVGYFVGPYVAKAWNYLGARLAGLIKGSFKTIAKLTAEKMKHINVGKHLWSKVLGKNVTNTNIQSLIYRAVRSGNWGLDSKDVLQILWKYKGQIIVVTGKVVDGVLKIGNAWVQR